MWTRRGFIAALPLPWPAAAAAARTLTVGPPGAGPGFAEAIAAARDGDVIEVRPGTYRGEVAVIRQRRLTIRGSGARPVFDAAGRDAEGKAIWVVRDGEVTVHNVAFRGARVPHGNGAGIRFERGRLRLVRCAFFDNENGVLTANSGDAELDVIDCEFGDAPRHPGSLHHLLYAGRIARLGVSGSRFGGGWRGHLVKSRAAVTILACNLLDDSDGAASYEVDLPDGGEATLLGNVIVQGAASENATLVSFGAEGAPWPRSALALAHNTLASRRSGGDTIFVRVWPERLPPATAVTLVNNLTLGAGRLELGPDVQPLGHAALPAVPPDVEGLLRAPAALAGRGVDPREVGGRDLSLRAVFTLPVGTRPLPRAVPWTPGAMPR